MMRFFREQQRKKSEGGFTFLEMMVVVFIIAIISATAMPRFGGLLSGANMDAARRMILSTINACSRLSKMRRRDVHLTFKCGSEQLQVHVDEDQDESIADEDIYMTRTMPEKINLAGINTNTGDVTMIFTIHGTMSGTQGSIHFAPDDVPFVAGSSDEFNTIVIAGSTQKPRYYFYGKNSPF